MAGSAASSEWISERYERLKPGPGKSQESVTSHQRARIHRAVIDLAAEGGRRAITVRKVVKLAGVSTATFYTLFDGVDDCLISVSSTITSDVVRKILRRRILGATRTAQGDLIMQTLIDGFIRDPKAGRLALIESYAGGPAAVGAIRSQETSLAGALRDSLSRRGRRISSALSAWVTAGALRAIRCSLAGDDRKRSRVPAKDLFAWARACLVGPELDVRCLDRPPGDLLASEQRSGPTTDGLGETQLLDAAVERMARAEGYWRISESRVSRAAGIPKTHFRRHYRDIDGAYLAAVECIARGLFEPLVEDTEAPDWTGHICRQIDAVADRVEADEAGRALVLGEMLAPGLPGITAKEHLLDDLARGWQRSLDRAGCQSGFWPETAVAGLWEALSRSGTDHEPSRRRLAPTFALFVLSPVVGPGPASAAVEREFVIGPSITGGTCISG